MIYDFVQRLITVTVIIFFIGLVLVTAAFTTISALCVVFGWVIEWWLPLVALPALCIFATIFDILVDMGV